MSQSPLDKEIDDLERAFDDFRFKYRTVEQAEYVLKYAALLLAAVVREEES